MANVTWKISRRGNTQLPLVIVLALAVVLVLLGKAQNALFDRARMRITDWMQPLLTSVHAPVAAFDRWLGSADELFRVYQENLALKQENARLRQWRNVAVVMEGRVNRYQALLHAVPDPELNSALAHVIGRANRPFLQTMILDAGAAASIKPGEAVMDASGMIGRIYLAGDHTSWVILLTDLNSRVPVVIAAGNGHDIQAMMTGDNSAMPSLDTLSQTVSLHAGDQVVSSGDGGLVPAGLPVGSVVATPGGGYRVALLADPASSEDVEVLAFHAPPEALPQTTRTTLPAVAAGLPPAAPPTPSPPATPTLATPVPGAASNPQTKPVASTPAAAKPKPASAQKPVPDGPLPPSDTAGNE